jgi:mono/diheme cytochrome c family protein
MARPHPKHDDAERIYIWELPKRGSPTMPAGLLTSRQAQDAGGVIFAADCAICHRAKGDGHGQRRDAMRPPPANLTLPPWSEATNAARVYGAIKDGVPGTAMPSWPALSDEEIWNVVAYIHALRAP